MTNIDFTKAPEKDGQEYIDYLMSLHYEFKRYMDEQDFQGAANFMGLFNNDDVNVNVLKTLSIISYGLKDLSEFKDIRISIVNILNKKLKDKNPNSIEHG